MKTKITINLNEIKKVQQFAQTVVLFESDIDIVRGRYVIDAKSIIGIFTLDLSKPVDLIIHSENEDEINRFNEAMKEFM